MLNFQNHHKASVYAFDIPLLHFDYHIECRGGNYKNPEKLKLSFEIPKFWHFIYILQNHHKASVYALDIPLLHFDYHSECRGGNYKNLEKLKSSLMKYLNNFEFFHSEGEETKKWVNFFRSTAWSDKRMGT